MEQVLYSHQYVAHSCQRYGVSCLQLQVWSQFSTVAIMDTFLYNQSMEPILYSHQYGAVARMELIIYSCQYGSSSLQGASMESDFLNHNYEASSLQSPVLSRFSTVASMDPIIYNG